MKNEICLTECSHKKIIEKVKKSISPDEILFILAEFFKVFGDSTRIKILQALSVSEMCVCDIAALINSTQSAVSHQLRILRSASLVKHHKDGRTVFYSLNDHHIKTIISTGMEHILEKGK
ncbi:MAG: winged helix-turn-helix transcriptional regulator [Spirochaetes bacterium]|nr:winged helix-turn-helix transcriptional regulator [Spirochaetota bacterium]